METKQNIEKNLKVFMMEGDFFSKIGNKSLEINVGLTQSNKPININPRSGNFPKPYSSRGA